MIKVTIILICIFNVLACNPVEPHSAQHSVQQIQKYPFSCLSSQSRCVVETELGQVSIEFSGLTEQGKLKTELPFQIQLQFEPGDKNHQLMTMESYLEGTTMFMGKVPVFFEQSLTKNKAKAETLLASCSEAVMTWRLWLTIDISVGDKVKQQRFFIDFDSKRL